MKKVISVVLAAVLMSALCVCAFAASNPFAPSVMTKGIPSIVPQSVESLVYDVELFKDGEDSYYCKTTASDDSAEVLIVPFSDFSVDNEYVDTDYACKAFEEIKAYGDDLSKLNSRLDPSYIVRDFFDITIKEGTDAYDYFYNKGYSLKITFAMNTTGVGNIYVMNKCSEADGWELAKITGKTANSITVVFDKLCPVMILVPGEETPAPGTGVQSTAVFGVLAAVFAIASVAVIVYKKKKTVTE